MDRLYPIDVDLKTLSPLTLAFVGDGVYELMVRERLASTANRPAGALHHAAVAQVRAEAQAEAIKRLTPLLTEKELAVFKRGRNAHTVRSGDDYHRATGLEALFGYLYLNGEIDRIRRLFSVAVGDTTVDDAIACGGTQHEEETTQKEQAAKKGETAGTDQGSAD
ncbi:MAG: ribonuclease III [Clostridia bacterium]|nr:ribonuclease III [Clostridia bacterium]